MPRAEADIVYQCGSYWVSLEKRGYVVWVDGATHASSLVSYSGTPDGKSLAVAYAAYMGKKAVANG